MKIHLTLAAPALWLSACAYEPTPLPNVAALQAATNTAVSSPIRYQNPMAGYVYRAPVGPRDWRSVNQEQTESH